MRHPWTCYVTQSSAWRGRSRRSSRSSKKSNKRLQRGRLGLHPLPLPVWRRHRELPRLHECALASRKPSFVSSIPAIELHKAVPFT